MARDREAGAQPLTEADIGSFAEESFLPWNDGQDMRSNMMSAFNHFVQSSGLTTELSALEEKDYMNRFIGDCSERLQGLQHEDVNSVWSRALKKALDDEMPEVTDYSVEYINSQQLGFTAKKHDVYVSRREFKNQLGLDVPDDIELELDAVDETSMARSAGAPATFDTRSKWPQCADVFLRNHNQGSCSADWAFAPASVLDSRICIGSGGTDKIVLSRQYLMTCSSGYGCSGGWPSKVFKYFWTNGSPSEECSPFLGTGKHGCPSKCKSGYPRSLQSDLFMDMTPKGGKTWSWDKNGESAHTSAQMAMYQGGPVVGMVDAASNGNRFFSYGSGLFDGRCGGTVDHALSVTGWSTARGNTYYTILNSWGRGWGENGTMRASKCMLLYFTDPGPIDV